VSVKNEQAVADYWRCVAELRAGLANLQEFVDTLPVADRTGIPSPFHYGHLGTVQRLHEMIGNASKMVDSFAMRQYNCNPGAIRGIFGR